jgi:hypothetical protein
MSEIKISDAENPSPLAVSCGRFMFIFVGLIMLGLGGWFLYDKQNDQVFLAAVVAISGVIKIWCGLSMQDKTVAHFGFWLAYFLD